jgi:hypothetical protein
MSALCLSRPASRYLLSSKSPVQPAREPRYQVDRRASIDEPSSSYLPRHIRHGSGQSAYTIQVHNADEDARSNTSSIRTVRRNQAFADLNQRNPSPVQSSSQPKHKRNSSWTSKVKDMAKKAMGRSSTECRVEVDTVLMEVASTHPPTR